ncbi:MAG: helix-turn-helix domain-containing protein [Oscillospiraceae bacterium]|nr:helix-turn-helix domain-containing protein [Oscillospiraceae bacterium]
MDIEDFVTAAEAAALMGRGVNLVGKLCQAGRLPGARKVGTNWFIPRASVLAYRPRKRGRKTQKERDKKVLEEFLSSELAKNP